MKKKVSKENKKAGTSFEMCCVNMSPPPAILLTREAVRYARERTCPPSIWGKPIADVEHLFIWLAVLICFSSAISK